MKVLWVSARLIGPAASIMSTDYSGTSGGWIQSEYDCLSEEMLEIVHLCGVREKLDKAYKKVENEKGTLYLLELPRVSNGRKASTQMIDSVRLILSEVNPDIIQLWGTETCIQDAVVSSDNSIPVVVFIQGLIGVHYRYRGGYMTVLNRDYYSYSSLKQKFLKYCRDLAFENQVSIEKNIIYKAKHVIVDSDFARSYCSSLGDDVSCYTRHLNPNKLFLNKKWEYSSCEKNTIFTVFGGSPDKGLHQLLKAITIVKKKIPNVKVLIPGPFHIDDEGRIMRINQLSTYEKWMASYIDKYSLHDNVYFIGSQSPEGMAMQIAKCNVYVNPSCMEVHALSLREAMTVGAPIISSLCGSVAEFITYGRDGYIYRYEEYELLAFLIIKILSDNQLAKSLGNNAREKMMEFFNSSETENLYNIYRRILGC